LSSSFKKIDEGKTLERMAIESIETNSGHHHRDKDAALRRILY
jgi:hypothetical protein